MSLDVHEVDQRVAAARAAVEAIMAFVHKEHPAVTCIEAAANLETVNATMRRHLLTNTALVAVGRAMRFADDHFVPCADVLMHAEMAAAGGPEDFVEHFVEQMAAHRVAVAHECGTDQALMTSLHDPRVTPASRAKATELIACHEVISALAVLAENDVDAAPVLSWMASVVSCRD